MTNKEMDIVNMIVESYISVMGVDKWNSLNDKQQHDVIMIVTKDFYNAINAI